MAVACGAGGDALRVHQVFTKVASEHIGSGLGALVVEFTAVVTILVYLGYMKLVVGASEPVSSRGVALSAVTGVCVGAGTVIFFVLFQRGGPLSAVPAVLAVGAALMAVVGMVFLGKRVSTARILGVFFSLAGLYLVGR